MADETLTLSLDSGGDVKIAQVDVRPEHLGRRSTLDLAVWGDVKETLDCLTRGSAPRPTGASLSTICGVRWTPGSPSLRRGISIEAAMAIMAMANNISSALPSTSLASCAPASAPANPDRANTVAHGHLTRPARAWPASPVAALTATAAAEVPIAAWVSASPTM